MPSAKGLLSKFGGNTIGTAAGVAAGSSTARTLDPLLQDLTNETWKSHAVVPVDAYALGEGVAQGQVDPKKAAGWAAEQGIGGDQFRAIVDIASVGPPLAQAYSLLRRGLFDSAQFKIALNRLGIEARWWERLTDLKDERLDPADVARGIHKSVIRDPGLLATPQPTATGKVPPYPVSHVDALSEAAAHGLDKDRLGVLVGLQGNPMGAHEAAQAVFRGVIEPADYDRAVAEGNTRNEWGDAIFEQSRQIPTARDFLENALRGYSTLADAIEGAAKHGLSAEDATLIYQNQGRPMTVHQITMALARGAKFNPEPGEITDPYMASIVEGSLKPGYYEMEAALKYNYPAFFQTLNALAKGWIDAATAREWLLYQAYEPGAVDAIISNVQKGGSAKTSTWVTRAQSYLFTAIHKQYEDTAAYTAQARSAMSLIGIADDDQTEILRLLAAEAALGAGTAGAAGSGGAGATA